MPESGREATNPRPHSAPDALPREENDEFGHPIPYPRPQTVFSRIKLSSRMYSKNSLFISNIPMGTSFSQIHAIFPKVVRVSMDLQTPTGLSICAVVEFANEEDCRDVYDGFKRVYIGGRRIFISPKLRDRNL